MLRNVSLKGVIIGAVFDVVGTNIWIFAVVGYLIIKHQLYALPSSDQQTSELGSQSLVDTWRLELPVITSG